MQTEQITLHSQMEENHWWFVGRRRIATALIHHLLPASQGKTIVDIGCGTGGNIASLTPDYQCVGLDPSEEAIRLAQQRFPALSFVHGPIPSALAPIAPHAHLLLLMDVLEHVQDDSQLLSGIIQWMSPGSLLLITVPADMTLWSPHDVSFGHFRRYDRDGLERVWAHLPVTPLLISYYNTLLYPIIRWIRTRNRQRHQSYGDSGTDFRIPPAPVNRLLTALFASEAPALVRQLKERRAPSIPRGVSLLAVLQRENG